MQVFDYIRLPICAIKCVGDFVSINNPSVGRERGCEEIQHVCARDTTEGGSWIQDVTVILAEISDIG